MKVPGNHHNITSTCSQRANANNFMITLALTMSAKTDSCDTYRRPSNWPKFVARVKTGMTVKIGSLKTSPYHQHGSDVADCCVHAFS
jgi:hypothetical protein